MVGHLIDGGKLLHDLGGGGYVSYISYIPFERLYDGYTTQCRIGIRFLLGAFLSYIVMLLYAALIIYSL